MLLEMMQRPFYCFIAAMLVISSFGCRSGRVASKYVDLTVKDSLTNEEVWVEMEWEGPDVPCGLMSKGIEATYVDFEWFFPEECTFKVTDKAQHSTFEIPVSFKELNKRFQAGGVKNIKLDIISTNEVVITTN